MFIRPNNYTMPLGHLNKFFTVLLKQNDHVVFYTLHRLKKCLVKKSAYTRCMCLDDASQKCHVTKLIQHFILRR